MKRVALLFIGVMVLFGQNLFSKEKGELKVINYNIWNGFDWGKSLEREALFVDWVVEQAPDVLALQELCGFTQNKLERVAARYGHPYAVILKEGGYPVGITSKYPIEVIEKRTEDMWHGYLHCKVNGVHYMVVHLSPAQYQFRNREATFILDKLESLVAEGEDIVVLGDYNAHAEVDAKVLGGKPDLLEANRAYDKGKAEEVCTLREGEFDYGVIQKFIDRGFTDISYKLNKKIGYRWSFPAEALVSAEQCELKGQRIDFQMVSRSMAKRGQSVEIVHDSKTKQISDHYPVVVTYRR